MTHIEMLAAVLVSSSSGTPDTPTAPGGIIAWIVCYKQRRSEIGGWLLFFYWQLYGGVLLTLLFFFAAFQSYVPESFEDPNVYHMFFLSAVPGLALFAIQVAVGTTLISVRTWDMVKLLRWVMVAGLLATVLSLVINSYMFPENIPFDVLSTITSCIWLAYFWTSARVKHVFQAHDWAVAVERIHPEKATT